MPVIDGVKMACAACIRGHRSTSCQHADRPLLEVRKKGRPMSQCNHCRELRKVKQVHVRCACRPDESEAPKRVVKGKEKKVEVDVPEPGCSCDETGVCSCATPRSIVSSRRLSVPSGSPATPTSDKSCCSRVEDSTIPRCGSSSESTSSPHSVPTSNCCSQSNEDPSPSTSSCTNPPTPPDPIGFQSGLEMPGQSPFSESQASQYTDLSWMDLGMVPSSRSHRYTPYPQSTQSISTASASTLPKHPIYRHIPIKNAILPPSTGPFDAETALWDQILRGDPLPQDPAPRLNPVLPTTSAQPPPLIPPPNCSCIPCDRHAADPSSLPTCSEVGICDTCFDCTALQAALATIDIPSQPTNTTSQEAFIPTNPIVPSVSLNPPPPYDAPGSNLPFSSAINPAFVPAPAPLHLHTTIIQASPSSLPSSALTSIPPFTCTCTSDCTRWGCTGQEGGESQGNGDCIVCGAHGECDAFTEALKELQKHFTESTPAAEVSDLGLV